MAGNSPREDEVDYMGSFLTRVRKDTVGALAAIVSWNALTSVVPIMVSCSVIVHVGAEVVAIGALQSGHTTRSARHVPEPEPPHKRT
jgi:uncharacterized BrkB/YihY/UPF0761 family membrane protein